MEIMSTSYKEEKQKSPDKGDMDILADLEKANQKLFDKVQKTANR